MRFFVVAVWRQVGNAVLMRCGLAELR